MARDDLIEDIYPLSPMQQGMLFHTIYAPQSGVYFEQVHLCIEGDFNIPAFKRAWDEVINRHAVLRTAFLWERSDKPLQVVLKKVKMPWSEQDWRSLALAQQQQLLNTLLDVDRERGFEIANAPLMRMALMRSGEDKYQFVWSFHHLLLDGWSADLVIKEVFARYKGIIAGEEAMISESRPYKDYIAWLQRQDLKRAEEFWRQSLKGFTAPTQISANGRSNHLPHKMEYAHKDVRLPSDILSMLKILAREYRITLNTIIQGAWGSYSVATAMRKT